MNEERQDEHDDQDGLTQDADDQDGGEDVSHAAIIDGGPSGPEEAEAPSGGDQRPYSGPERRQDRLDAFDRLGRWLLDRAGAWAAMALVHYLLIAFIAIGVARLADRSTDEIHALTAQVDQLEATAQDARAVADYLRNCIVTEEAKRDPARCGPQSSAVILASLVTYLNCSFLILPADRTEAKLMACARKGFGG